MSMDIKDLSSWPDGLRAIHESRGMRFLHEQKMRTFSTNILRMNGTELLAAAARLHDEEVGISLMDVSNEDAGNQAHRELKRHLHNFVASAMTLVDHTRVMLSDLYDGQPIHAEILERITEGVGRSPVCKFVQNMRNYIVHKGLPNSERYFECNSTDGEVVFKTGVRIKAAALMAWNGWTALAKDYIREAGEYIEIQEFAQEYLDEVGEFGEWLERRLTAHHSNDLVELRQLQLKCQPEQAAVEEVDCLEVQSISDELTSEYHHKIDGLSVSLLEKIGRFELPSRVVADKSFSTHRPVVSISDQASLNSAVVRGYDINDMEVVLFIHEEGESYGLSEQDMASWQELFSDASFAAWVGRRFDHEFMIDAFIAWARAGWKAVVVKPFFEFLESKVAEEVALQEVFYPIAQFEVEVGFKFGPVIIMPLVNEFFDNIEARFGGALVPEQVQGYLSKLRGKYLGFAAVRLEVEAHPNFIKDASYHFAKDSIDLLRFFAPSSPYSYRRTSLALKGREYTPLQNMISLSRTGFMGMEEVCPEFAERWQLSERGIKELLSGGAARAGRLVNVVGLSEFEKSVRAALILFGKGSTMESGFDRLRYTLSAAEEIYLRHSQEHAESSIAKRIASLVVFEDVDSQRLSECISKSYSIRSDSEASSPLASEAVMIATHGIYNAIVIALNNVEGFVNKVDYIAALENN